MTPFIFIVGAQRSGTTWLQRLLVSHPQIAGGQESHLLSGYLAPLWQRWQLERGYCDNGGRGIGLNCYLDEQEFLDELRGLARRILGRTLQAKPGASLIVEKTPDHALHLPLLHRLFPDAVVLHLLRDGRDVVASLLHAKQEEWGRDWAPKSAAEAAQRWMDWVRTIQRDLPLFPRSRTLRYEELSARPVEVLAELFDYLGVPLPDSDIETICRRWDFSANSANGQADSLWRRDPGEVLEPQGFHRTGQVGDGRQSLAQGAQAVVVQEAGELLHELGYDVTLPRRRRGGDEAFVSTAAEDDTIWTMPRSLAVIDTTNAQMLHRERLLLYSTVLALAPERCLEIGVCEGGSTRIIHAALRDLGQGRLISIDPKLQVAPELSQKLADRVTFLEMPSPQGLQMALEKAGGLFDFVLIDGDHSESGVRSDLIGLLEATRPGTVILAHDAYYRGVEAGIRSVLRERLPFLDAGLISTTRHPGRQGETPVAYGGFHLLIRTSGSARTIHRALHSALRTPRSALRALRSTLRALLRRRAAHAVGGPPG